MTYLVTNQKYGLFDTVKRVLLFATHIFDF